MSTNAILGFVRLVFTLSLIAAMGICFAQNAVVPAKRLTQAPTIDGNVGDDEWKDAAHVTGLYDTQTGAVAPDAADFYLGYDENFIYFSAKVSDSAPGQIRASEYRTNVSLDGDDSVSLAVDLSGSGADMNTFRVNPRGATEIELSGGRAAKREWTGEFLAKARITPTGWEAEARIPWQVMRLTSAGKRNLKINFGRNIARTNREFIFQYVPDGLQSHPIWSDVEVPRQELLRTLKLLPYVYAGWDPNTRHIANAGLDLKTQITDQIEFVGTINPDFRNIENQILSLDFSRFERIAGESRPFFQEGRNYMDSALFASQRIDTFDVGVNTYGKLSDKTSFALLNTIDWDRQNLFLGNVERGTRVNFAANATHAFDPTLNVRATYTRVDRPDLKNDAHLIRLSKTYGDFNVFVRNMGSQDSFQGRGESNDAYLNYERNGMGAYVGFNSYSPDFLPRLGFFEEVDLRGWDTANYYNKNFDHGPINDWGYFVSAKSFQKYNGDPYRHEYFINPFTTLRNGLALIPYAQLGEFEGVVDSLYGLQVAFPRGNPTRNVAATIESGRLEDAPYHSLRLQAAYRFWGRLQLNGSYQVVDHFGNTNQTILTANYDLGGDRSVAGRLVRRNDDTNFYVALKQSGNLGTEYFLILGDPNAQTFRSSLILKVVVPFEIPLGKRKIVKRETISS